MVCGMCLNKNMNSLLNKNIDLLPHILVNRFIVQTGFTLHMVEGNDLFTLITNAPDAQHG